VWKLRKVLKSDDTAVIIAEPRRYTLEFCPDGTVTIRADCNQAGGTSTTNGNQISIAATHTTLAACPPDSLSDEYLRHLGEVYAYGFDGPSFGPKCGSIQAL
jgi:heat shock protein HslJ